MSTHKSTKKRGATGATFSTDPESAFTAFYNLHLGRGWKLFDLVRNPQPKKLPTVLTREQVKGLFSVVREERFRVFFRLVYACCQRSPGIDPPSLV